MRLKIMLEIFIASESGIRGLLRSGSRVNTFLSNLNYSIHMGGSCTTMEQKSYSYYNSSFILPASLSILLLSSRFLNMFNCSLLGSIKAKLSFNLFNKQSKMLFICTEI